jgi:hypothetical protein
MLLKILKLYKMVVICAIALLLHSGFCKGVNFVHPGYVHLGCVCVDHKKTWNWWYARNHEAALKTVLCIHIT